MEKDKQVVWGDRLGYRVLLQGTTGWQGLLPSTDSWEPASGLTRLDLFREYNKMNKLEGRVLMQARCERLADKKALSVAEAVGRWNKEVTER